MICASFEWNSSQPAGTVCGRTQQIIDGIVQAVLDRDEVPEAHVFTDCGPMPGRTPALQQYVAQRRLAWKHLALLPTLVEKQSYVALADESGFASVAALRDGMGHVRFPICAVVHALGQPDIAGWLACNLLRAERCDVMMVTSDAVGTGLTRALDTVATWFEKSAVSVARPGVERIPVTVDVDVFKPRDKTYCRDVLELPRDRTLVLYDGPAGSGLGADPEFVLACLKELLAPHPEMMVVVHVVEGRANELTSLAGSLGMFDHLRILTSVPVHAQPLIPAASDIYVSVENRIQADSGLPILQAMASGVPVVTSDWNGSREMIDDGLNGFLVPTLWNPVAGAMMSWLAAGDWGDRFLADRTIVDRRALRGALEALLSSPERRSAFGQRARSSVEANHSSRCAGKRIADVWRAQRAECERNVSESQRPTIDYTQVFKHYATADLSVDLKLRVSARGQPLLGNALHGADTRCAPPLLRMDVAKTLDRAGNAPTTVRRCIEGGSEFALEAIVWLLRKGYVEILSAEQ